MVYNFLPLLHEANFLRSVWNNLLPLNMVFAQNSTACCERHYREQRQDGRKSPNSCCVNTFINTGIAAPNYHQMDGTERSVVAFFSHATNAALGISISQSNILVQSKISQQREGIGWISIFHLALPAGWNLHLSNPVFHDKILQKTNEQFSIIYVILMCILSFMLT